MTYPITTQKALRAAFWEAHPQLHRALPCSLTRNGRVFRIPKTQNEHPTDTRVAFVDFIDCLCRSGQISEALAQRATLG